MTDITPEKVREKLAREVGLYPFTWEALAEAYLEEERKLAAVRALQAEWHDRACEARSDRPTYRSAARDLRAALGGDHERGEVWVDSPADVSYDSLNDWKPVSPGNHERGPDEADALTTPALAGDHDQPEHDNDCSSGAGFVDPYCTVCNWCRDHEQPTPERTAEVDAAMRDFMGRMFGGPMSGGPHG